MVKEMMKTVRNTTYLCLTVLPVLLFFLSVNICYGSTGDVNNDHEVNLGDLELVSSYWLGDLNLVDFDNSGLVDFIDFAHLGRNWAAFPE